MAEIDMMLPYFLNGKMVFHLRIEQTFDGDFWSWSFQSTLPDVLLWSSLPELHRKIKRPHKKLTVSSAYFLMKRVADSVIANPISRYFYYPNYLLSEKGEIEEKRAKELLFFLGVQELRKGLAATRRDNPELLYVIQAILLSGYFYYSQEFDSLITKVDVNEIISLPQGLVCVGNPRLTWWKYENKSLTFYYSAEHRHLLHQFFVTRNIK